MRRLDPIPIGVRVPRRGSPLLQRMILGCFRAAGWRFEGAIADLPKMVMIGAPHTSNWDFLLGMCTVFGLGLDIHWLGKHTIFTRITTPFLRWAGGIPVNRRRPGGILFDVVDRFRHGDAFILALSPEGTRSPVDRWKAGFHRIACEVGVPVVAGAIDFDRKCVTFHPPVTMTGDFDADVRRLKTLFETAGARYPEKYVGLPAE